MPRVERSAGFVIFARDSGALTTEYLLLDYGRHWDFPKGHVEKGEDDLTAARRELAEETGVALAHVIPGFAEEVIYFFRHKHHGLVRKSVMFFLARIDTREIVISHEHTGFVFLDFAAAEKRLTFPTARAVLRKANERLTAPD